MFSFSKLKIKIITILMILNTKLLKLNFKPIFKKKLVPSLTVITN